MEEPLPRYWGQDLGRAEREVRRHLYVVNGKRRRRPSWRELPEELLAPRVLVRSGLFTRTSSREAQLGVERTVPNGTSFFRGVPLRWWDLRALLAICAQSGNDGAAEMPPTRLLRSIGQGPSVRGLERARDSLQRLCSARIAFDLAGFGRVGERDQHLVGGEGEVVVADQLRVQAPDELAVRAEHAAPGGELPAIELRCAGIGPGGHVSRLPVKSDVVAQSITLQV